MELSTWVLMWYLDNKVFAWLLQKEIQIYSVMFRIVKKLRFINNYRQTEKKRELRAECQLIIWYRIWCVLLGAFQITLKSGTYTCWLLLSKKKNLYSSILFKRPIISWIIAFSHLWNRNIEGQKCWMILFILLPSVYYHSRLMKYSHWNTWSAIESDLEDLRCSVSAVMYLVWRLVMGSTMRDMADCWFLFF